MLEIVWDWHIHSHNSPCGQEAATIAKVAAEVRASGIERWGLTDHLFTELNVGALEAGRREFDEAAGGGGGAVFAVEATVLRPWDIARTRETGNIWGYHPGGPEESLTMYLPEELEKRLGIAYVIAGAHWPLGCAMSPEACVRNYHRQNMFLAEHPQVDIIAHPWWWRKYFETATEKLDFFWLADFSIIPRSMHEEFAAAAREHGKLIEVNASNVPPDESGSRWGALYLEYLALLRERGCRFSIGSDSHAAEYRPRPQRLGEQLARMGFQQEDFWTGPKV